MNKLIPFTRDSLSTAPAVVDPSSALADALSTAILVMGGQRGFDFALEHGINAVVFDAGMIHVTPGLSGSFGMS